MPVPVPVSVFGAAVCAGLAAWLLVERGRALRRAESLLGGGNDGSTTGAVRRRPVVTWESTLRILRDRLVGWGKEWLALPASVLLALWGESVLPLLAGAVAVPLARRGLRAGETRRAAERRADAVRRLGDALVGELRAGAQPAEALITAVRAVGREFDGPELASVVAATGSAATSPRHCAGLRDDRERTASSAWPPAGGSRWTAERDWPTGSTASAPDCGPSGTSGTPCGPSWSARGPRWWCWRSCPWLPWPWAGPWAPTR